MTTTKSALEVLTEKAEEIERERARVQARVEAEVAAAEERRQAAYAEFDRQTVADYDDAQHNRAVADAEQALNAALLADPVWSAVANLTRVQRERSNAQAATSTAAQRLGVNPPPYIHPGGLWPISVDRLLQVANQAGENQAADLADALDQARIDAGEAAARGDGR